MLTRLTVTTMIIALFGFGFSLLVRHDGGSGGRAYAGQAGSGCVIEGAFCGAGTRAASR